MAFVFHQRHFFPEFTLHFPNLRCKKICDLSSHHFILTIFDSDAVKYYSNVMSKGICRSNTTVECGIIKLFW